MKKAATLLILVFLVFTPLLAASVLPNNLMTTTAREESVQDIVPLNIFQEASAVQRQVRVALYDETNGTAPSYSYSGAWTTNVTLIENLLVSQGFAVTRLTAGDIHGTDTLRTALFDVFLMLDNNPRESITREVLDFWRGGGGILSFDGAVSFLCYFGIMVPDSAGDNGHGVYWTYQWSANHTVASRHPVTQSSMIGDKFTDNFDWATFNWSALQGFSYSSEYTKLTITESGNNWVSALARDTVKGGRVVQTFGDGNPITPNYAQTIADAINWLCPRPKARVVLTTLITPTMESTQVIQTLDTTLLIALLTGEMHL